jgi:phosphoglycerol transferase MdoB-like AlkP superfamily enzyme
MAFKQDGFRANHLLKLTRTDTAAVLLYMIIVYAAAMSFFTFFRIILYIVNIGMIDEDCDMWYLARAMLNGLQFDSLIASFITIIPLIGLSVMSLCKRITKRAVTASNVYFNIMYTLSFIISIADIPYFSYSLTHLSKTAFGWFEFGRDTTRLLFQEITYYPYIGLMVISGAAFSFAVRQAGRRLLKMNTDGGGMKSLRYTIPLAVLAWGMCAAGMRGSLQRYPLRVDYAYFSDNTFFNQLGINPTFFLVKSLSMKSKQNVNDLMPAEEAIAIVQKELNISPNNSLCPLRREVVPERAAQSPANVVIILLESMAVKYLECEYEGKALMPYIRELITHSYYFSNFYSTGVHTNNGIVSTLYGFPALFDEPSMDSAPNRYDGLPNELKRHGYRTMFFLGGNPGYDHMNSFLYENGFDRIYSQEDYPKDRRVNNFGVSDDFLLGYALDKLNETARSDSPFLATILTVSNHVPYIVPDEYKDSAESNDKRILRFVDDAIRDFMTKASGEAWFANTLFVLLGDHGRILDGNTYEMPLTYNHIPLIIFSEGLSDSPRAIGGFSNQTDVFPTVMGLLNLPYTNNSMGVDLLKESRPCVYFVNDNQLGCIDSSHIYIRNLPPRKDLLYRLDCDNSPNLIEEEPDAGAKLKRYAVSMMVTADHLIKSRRTRDGKQF